MSEQTHSYDTEIEWIGEHKGEVRATGFPTLTVATPPEFKGHEGIWTPEHFFVASVNACLMTTFLAIAELSKLNFVAFRSWAQGKLEKVEGQGVQITEIVLRPHVTVTQERDRERAARKAKPAQAGAKHSAAMRPSDTGNGRPAGMATAPARPAFVPVRLVDEPLARGSGLEVVCRGGRVVRVAAGFAADTLGQVVAVLEGLPC